MGMTITNRQFALIAGAGYVGIFFAAIFANFVVLDGIKAEPLMMVVAHEQQVRIGAMAFLVAAVCDVLVAWALFHMYARHAFSTVSTYFRIMHAAIMGAAVYALLAATAETTAEGVLAQVSIFDSLWLIGLFFFGVHLLFLSRIVRQIRFIPYMLAAAGVMYIVDTTAQFTYLSYAAHADLFLTLVAIPSILGEMSFAIWLLWRGGKVSAE